jgi:hypothetical protein
MSVSALPGICDNSELQRKFWADRIKKYGNRDNAYKMTPLSEIQEFSSFIESQYKDLTIPAGAAAADVKAIEKQLAKVRTTTVGKVQRMNSVLKKAGIALGALAVFGTVCENTTLANNILNPPPQVQGALNELLTVYGRGYSEALQTGLVSRNTWGLITDRLSNYMNAARFDDNTKATIIRQFILTEEQLGP